SSLLEAPLWKERHLETGDGLDTARNDVAFESVELFVRHFAERGKGNRFGHFDDARARVRTETFEPELLRGRIRPGVAPAQSPAVGERMFDPPHSPTLLVEHQVVDHATHGELGIFSDWIILQVFVATVTVDEIFPLGIPRADAAAERQPH